MWVCMWVAGGCMCIFLSVRLFVVGGCVCRVRRRLYPVPVAAAVAALQCTHENMLLPLLLYVGAPNRTRCAAITRVRAAAKRPAKNIILYHAIVYDTGYNIKDEDDERAHTQHKNVHAKFVLCCARGWFLFVLWSSPWSISVFAYTKQWNKSLPEREVVHDM